MRRFVPTAERGDKTLDHQTTAELIAIANGDDDAAAYDAIDLLDQLENVHAEVTCQEYDRVEARWSRMMLRRNMDPWNPAPPPTLVAGWFDGMREDRGWKPIALHVRALQTAFVRRGLPDPTANPLVIRTLATLRINARPKTRGQEPLLVEDYLRVRRSIGGASLQDLRDRVALGLGFHGLLCLGEIAALDVEDIVFVASGALLHVRRRNTLRRVEIPRVTGDDVIVDLHEYLNRGDIVTGALMREIRADVARAGRLHIKSIAQILKRRLRESGLSDRRYAWGSLRAGYLASAQLRNVDELELAIRAGYTSVTRLRTRLESFGSHGKPLLDG